MISLSGVSKSYSQPVLDNVNLKIGKGEFVYVVGDSGAGKTTLLKLLYGEERPSSGNIQILGQDLSRVAQPRLQAIRRRIGVIFQDLKLIEDLSAKDNILLALETSDTQAVASAQSLHERQRLLDEAVGLFGIGALLKKKVRSLSGGERQRVAAARALVRRPDILIADEPTGSLDRDQTWGLMDLFQKLHLRGTTVVLATHDREIVRRVRRRSFILKSGKLVVEDGICLF